jgi:glycogen synthase
MAYGTPPIVHAVGGLRDTVKPFNPFESSGTGWTFERAEADQMRGQIHNALVTYREHRDAFVALQRRGMEQDLRWAWEKTRVPVFGVVGGRVHAHAHVCLGVGVWTCLCLRG